MEKTEKKKKDKAKSPTKFKKINLSARPNAHEKRYLKALVDWEIKSNERRDLRVCGPIQLI